MLFQRLSDDAMTQSDEFNSLEGIYRSFKTMDDASYDAISKSVNRNSSVSEQTEINKSLVRNIFSNIFPDTNGFFYPSKTLWENISALASANPNNDSDAKDKIASLLRVYYYDQNSPNTGKEIQDFYTTPSTILFGNERLPLNSRPAPRPSAYTYPNPPNPSKKGKKGGSPDYEQSSLEQLIEKTLKNSEIKKIPSTLMMVLVDSPSINFKLRNASKAEIFLNYFSSLSMSRAVPYLEAKFTSRREGPGNSENLYQMSPLRFLLGPEAIKDTNGNTTPEFAPGTANRLLYDSSKNVIKIKPSSQENESPPELQTRSYQTGMEMFTMPQTLINMNYNQENNPRYTPVINPTTPFGTIISFNVSSETSHDAMSFKQATLILKIFDRSRLQEIADYLNPELYSSLEVSLIYGWVAPFQPSRNNDQNILIDEYSDFINKNMLVSEIFSVGNSMISIDNSGAATITLTLHTKGVGELRDVTPTGASLKFQKRQNEVQTIIENIKRLANKLGILEIYSKIPNLAVPIIITSATEGKMPELSSTDFKNQLDQIKKLLDKESFSADDLKSAAKEFLNNLQIFYNSKGEPTDPKAKTAQSQNLESIAQEIYKSRFKNLNSEHDLFAYSKKDKLDKFSKDNKIVKSMQKNHPLNENKVKGLPENYVSFGNLFATYFATACAGLTTTEDSSPIIDEYQIFFYNINDSAGQVSNLNIAEFPIDVKYIEKEYTRRIIEMKGERMSLINFLEIVRTSQFADERHQAYGFRDLYEIKDGEVLKTLRKGADFQKRVLTANLGGSGERFKKPEIDFFVESGYSNQSGTDKYQSLLQSYQVSAASNTGNSAYNASEDVKRILRIHIYDKQSLPEPLAVKLLKGTGGVYKVSGKYKGAGAFFNEIAGITAEKNEAETRKIVGRTQKEMKDNQQKKTDDIQTANDKLTRAKARFSNLFTKNITVSESGLEYRFYTFTDENKKPRFELVKQAVASMVPTITVGANGSMITSINYTTRQDENLNTIQILRNSQNPDGVANGTSVGNLPLSVIPGQLSLTSLGCPVIEYMQQFFIDLGTGTTIDNLYNVIKVGHTLTPGKYTTDITFGFADAYGSITTAKEIALEAEGLVKMIQEELQKSQTTSAPPRRR